MDAWAVKESGAGTQTHFPASPLLPARPFPPVSSLSRFSQSPFLPIPASPRPRVSPLPFSTSYQFAV